MGTYLGTTEIDNIYLGTTEVDKVYLGTTEVYTAGPALTTTPEIFNHTYNGGLGTHSWYVRSKDSNTSEIWSEFDDNTPESNYVTGMELNDTTNQETSGQVWSAGTVYAKALATSKTLSEYDSSYNPAL